MKRRHFIQNTVMGLSAFVVTPALPGSSARFFQQNSFVIPLQQAAAQIRHGALSLPQLGQIQSAATPFSWLGDVRRNLFFKNGFHHSEDASDMEIVSVFFQHPTKDTEEAIQIQFDPPSSRVLIGTEYWETSEGSGWQHIGSCSELDINIHLGLFESGTYDEMSLNPDSEYFLQVLEGSAYVNGFFLEKDYGLGCQHHSKLKLRNAENVRCLLLEFTG